MTDRIIKTVNRFKGASLFASSSVIKSLVSTAVTFVTIKWLNPEEIGFWQSLWVFQSYTFFVHIGVLTGLGRELPLSIGQKRTGEIEDILAVSNAVSLLSGLFLLLIFPLFLFFFIDYNPLYIIPIISIAITSSLNIYEVFLGACMRGNSMFNQFSKAQIIDTGVLICTIPLIILYGLNGLAIRYLIQVGAEVGIRLYMYPKIRRPKLKLEPIKKLMKSGVPIFLVEYLLNFLRSVPRLVLLSYGGFLAVGLFAPANAIVSFFQLIPTSLGRYIMPSVSKKVGQSVNKQEFWKISWLSTVVFLIIGVPIVLIGWSLLPPMIMHFFPKYALSIRAAQLALIAGLFSGSVINLNILYGIGNVKYMVIYIAVSLASIGFFTLLFANIMPPLEGVMVGSIIANVISLIAANTLVWHICKPESSLREY